MTFELDLEMINTNSLSKIHDDYFKKSVTSRVLTRYSFDFPSFFTPSDPVLNLAKIHWGKHSEQVSVRLGQNCALKNVNKLIVDDRQWTEDDHNSST